MFAEIFAAFAWACLVLALGTMLYGIGHLFVAFVRVMSSRVASAQTSGGIMPPGAAARGEETSQ